MGVMEQKTVAAAHDPMPPYPSHELRLGPLVHADHVRADAHIVQVEIVEAVGRRPQIGEGTVEAVGRLREIGRESCGERVGKYVEITVGVVVLKKKNKKK